MAQCLHCDSDASPQDARFCVMCGYAMKQPCPYATCSTEVTLGTHKAARANCPNCKRFYRVCFNCHRLHTLAETVCQTSRCNKHILSEPFPAFDGAHGGENQSFAARVPRRWSPQTTAAFGAPLPTQTVTALAYRYGWLLWLEGAELCALKITHLQSALAPRIERSPIGIVPLESNFLPHPQALRIAHGFIYVMGQGGAVRIAAPQGHAQRLELAANDGWDFESDTDEIPPLASLNWLLQCADETHWYAAATHGDDLILLECEAESAFVPRLMDAPDDASFPLDLTTRDGDLYLLTREAFWHRADNRWIMLWRKSDEFVPQGVLQYGGGWALWGHDGSRETRVIWLRPLETPSQYAIFSRTLGGSDLLNHPVVIGDWIYFWSHAVGGRAGANAILSLNLVLGQTQNPNLFAGAERAFWAAGAYGGNEGRWLLTAVDDGSNVVMRVQSLTADGRWNSDAGDWLLDAKWRPQRAAFALCDGRLAVATTSEEGSALQFFEM